MEAETLALAQGIDFSMWGLFARATFIVKVVMLILVVASFWSWSIIIQKLITYRSARREAQVFDEAFWSGNPLDELFEQIGTQPDGSSEKIFAAGMIEWIEQRGIEPGQRVVFLHTGGAPGLLR